MLVILEIFGNLTVIERGKYQGGYTVFPQFGVGINSVIMILLLWMFINGTQIHLCIKEEDKEYNKSIPKVFNDNL